MKSIKRLEIEKYVNKSELDKYKESFEISTDRIFEIKSHDEKNILKIYDLMKFGDNSSVRFNLLCRSNHLEIRDFLFYADFHSFKSFIVDFKKLYKNLSGEAIIEQYHEGHIIKLNGLKDGTIEVYCKVSPNKELYELCEMEFLIDQSYLLKMINEIDFIYEELEII
jgi:hypothetical protein